MILRLDERHMLIKTVMERGGDSTFPIVKFSIYLRDESDQVIPLGRLNDDSHVDGFLKYLDFLGFHIEEANCTEIAEIFDLMQPRKSILQGYDDLNFRKPGDLVDQEREKTGQIKSMGDPVIFVDKKKEDIARKYCETIRSPEFSSKESVGQIVLWAVDRLTGDLEQWKVSEDEASGKKVKCEVMEKDIIFALSPTVRSQE